MDRGLGTSSCRAKIANADEHIKRLHMYVDAWTDLDAARLIQWSTEDGSQHGVVMELDPEPDLWRWGVVLGDVMHNFRCALDHIVYFLAIHNTQKDPPDDDAKLAFPISSDPERFKASKYRIRSLSPEAQAAVERLQPYSRRRNDFSALWWLSQLNDADKHRLSLMLPIGTAIDSLEMDAAPGTYKVLHNTKAAHNGDPIILIELTEPRPNLYIDLKVTGAVSLQVEDRPPIGLYWLVDAIRRDVMIACRYLAQHFDEPATPFSWPH